MARPRRFRVLHATDGSARARAAMATSAAFPWPGHCEARAIVVRPGRFLPPHPDLWARSEAVTRRAAAAALRTLRARWTEADPVIRDGDVADQILAEASDWGAHALVIGWRGHGRFQRLLMGSVSRAVLRRATTPVLVVRRGSRAVTGIVVGVDGSAASDRAIRLLARCDVPQRGLITLVTVLPSQSLPGHRLLPGLTAELRAQVRAQVAKSRAAAERRQERLAGRLRQVGWRVRGQVRAGAPLFELLRSVDETGADVLVVGATSQRSIIKGFLGSTTEGAVNDSAVPVLVVP
ncbi:MAG: universal stress protein [Acidobacteriota bacterium]|nr:universal stress protein [Acidobacteriota bacterium]